MEMNSEAVVFWGFRPKNLSSTFFIYFRGE